MSFFSFPHFALLLRLGFLALCYPITRKGVQSERYCEVNSYFTVCKPRAVIRVRVRRCVIRIRIDETAIRIRIVIRATDNTAR